MTDAPRMTDEEIAAVIREHERARDIWADNAMGDNMAEQHARIATALRQLIAERDEAVAALGAVVLDAPSADPRVVMCPAQTSATECCATCGLCWSEAMADKTIGFLRHGMKRPGRGRSAPTEVLTT